MSVAVRSSATVEDSAEASCAGQFRTFLGARGTAEVVGRGRAVLAVGLRPARRRLPCRARPRCDRRRVAVIVQELVDARCAGVMFTQHPRTGDRSLIVIEASFGLGEAVVGGEVMPDLFEINKITRQIQQRSRGAKPHEHRLSEDAAPWSADRSILIASRPGLPPRRRLLPSRTWASVSSRRSAAALTSNGPSARPKAVTARKRSLPSRCGRSPSTPVTGTGVSVPNRERHRLHPRAAERQRERDTGIVSSDGGRTPAPS